MGLLARHRRFWFVALFAALLLPLVVQALEPYQDISEREGRRLEPEPAVPRQMAQWLAFPRAADRFIADHFGLRDTLVRANAILRYAAASPTDLRVVFGSHQWLFFNGDGAVEQTMGLLLRQNDIDRFADFALEQQTLWQARNVSFLVAIPPNAMTIMRERIPSWMANNPPVTEYDLMMHALAVRHVSFVDLRPSLTAENAKNPVYRRSDTHWNKLGALVVYNEVVKALNKPDWAIDTLQAYKGPEEISGGDLARMLGAPREIGDTEAKIDLTAYITPKITVSRLNTQRETGGNLTERDHPGASVLVLGDSFTEQAWRDYFSLHVGRLVWIHHELCDFVPEVVAAQKPDIVILAPTERFMFCWNKPRP